MNEDEIPTGVFYPDEISYIKEFKITEEDEDTTLVHINGGQDVFPPNGDNLLHESEESKLAKISTGEKSLSRSQQITKTLNQQTTRTFKQSQSHTHKKTTPGVFGRKT